MKGERTLKDFPFRYGGIERNYDIDWEGWIKIHEKVCGEKSNPYSKCYSCGGHGGNLYTKSGTLLRQSYPYAAFFRITKGKDKGKFKMRILCRACAYDYGVGVIEMDGKKYQDYLDFKESKYKKLLEEARHGQE